MHALSRKKPGGKCKPHKESKSLALKTHKENPWKVPGQAWEEPEEDQLSKKGLISDQRDSIQGHSFCLQMLVHAGSTGK